MASRRDFLASISAAAVASALASEKAADAQQRKANAAPAPIPAPAAAASGSQFGNLFPFLQSQSAKLKFPLSFSHDTYQDLAAWKRVAREKVFELLHYAPEPCAAAPQVLRRRERDAYIQEDLQFNTTADIRVPAALLIPKNQTQPGPAIVALHDHGGFYVWGREKLLENDDEHPVLTQFKATFYGGKSIAAELARRGYVVLVIDMFYWGDRRMLLDDDPADWRDRAASLTAERIQEFNRRASLNEQLVARGLYAAGLTWSGVMYWDDIRSVDYLVTRPEVDPQRIGCAGLSIGGLRSMHLAALDDRIRASVVCGWMASFPTQMKAHLRSSIGFTKLVPGLYRWLDYPDVAALAMPNAMLAINGRQDTLFEPGGVQASFDKLTACYRKAGVPERFRGSWYDTPHEFNVEMQREAWEWLDRWLKK